MSFPAYDEYQATGIEWSPKVPSEWTVTKLGRLLDELPCYGVLVPDSDDDGMPMLRITDMENGNANRDSLNKISQALSDQYSRTLVEVGDVVLSVVGTIGVAFKVDEDLAGVNLSRAVARIQVGDALHAEYLCWIFQSIQFRRYVDLICTGTAQRVLNMGDLTAFSVAAPDIAEQKAISAFLDVETAKIDGLVSEQRRLIELLKEKRQAVISHAVTKGLNPDAPMKPSGIPWLGDVPQHWKLIKLKLLAQIGNGSTPDRKNLKYWTDGTYPWLNSSVVNQSSVTESDQFVTQLALGECHLPKIEPPAVLVGITGQGRTRGMATILETEATINQHVAFLKPLDDRTSVSFIHRFFQMAYDYIRDESEGAGSTKGAITCGQLEKLKLPSPPIGELSEITKHLDAETERFDTLQAEAQRAIELLQERRTVLISAAVTGKIDVRSQNAKIANTLETA